MQRVRHHDDGTLWIPRADAEAEAWLDARYERWRPGELRWITTPDDRDDWTDVRNGMDEGRRGVLVGKGPSLDDWDQEHEGAILATLNETALVVRDPDLVFFVDARVGEALSGRLPFSTIPIRPPAVEALPALEDGQVGYLWQWTEGYRDHGVPSPLATAAAALVVLARWGVRDLLLVGFDGYDGDHSPDGRHVYARVLEPVQAGGRNNAGYRLINRQIDEVIARFGLLVAWQHRGESLETLSRG